MEKRFETREIAPQFTRAAIQSIDLEAREFDVVFATNSEVQMWNWDMGNYTEILDMNPKSVRLDRFNLGAPLYDNHQTYEGVEGVLGAIVPGTAKVDGNIGTCRVKMSTFQDPEGCIEGAWHKIKEGIIRTVSIGYSVYRAVIEDTEKKLYRATDWEPFELSLAPIPADIKAVVREKQNTNKIEIEVEAEDYQSDIDHVMIISERYRNI